VGKALIKEPLQRIDFKFLVLTALLCLGSSPKQSKTLQNIQGIEPGALATLATGSSNSGGGSVAPPSTGLRGRLTSLHIEIVSEDATLITAGSSCSQGVGVGAVCAGVAGHAAAAAAWVGAPLSPATPSGRQAPGPPPKLAAADEMALQGFSRSLESLALIGLEPQLRGCITRPWEPLLAEVAEGGPLLATFKRLALRGCGQIGTAAIAAAADISSLEQVDLSGSIVSVSDVERLARLAGLRGLGIAPLTATPSLMAALSEGCQVLQRLSVGALLLPPPPATPTSPSKSASVVDAAAVMPEPEILSSVRELQLLGCGAHGVQSLSRVGGLSHAAPIAVAFPHLSVLEIAGVWEIDVAAVAAICELVSMRSSRLQRLSLQGSTAHPLHAPLLLPLLAAPRPSGMQILAELELLCVDGLTDDLMLEVWDRTQKTGRCVYKQVRNLALGGVPPPPSCPIGVPPPGQQAPTLVPPPNAKKPAAAEQPAAGGSAGVVAAIAATLATSWSKQSLIAGSGGDGQMSDRGLVKLFGCNKLKYLSLHHLPGVTIGGVTALTRGVEHLECVTVVACPQVSSVARDVAAKAGRLGNEYCVRVDVIA